MNNFGKLLWILVSVSFYQFSVCQNPAGQLIVPSIISNFNQPCSQPSQCNSNAGLSCIPSTPSSSQRRCGCVTNSTTFDEYAGRCVGKVGHPCVYSGNQSYCPDKAHCHHQDPHHPDLFYIESRCFCDLNYFLDTKQGKCVLASKFGESCSNLGKKCDAVSGLKCSDGKCVCAFGKDQQYYDGKREKCVSYIGKNCTGFHSCPENARCDGSLVNRAVIGNEDEKLGRGRLRRQLQAPPPPSSRGSGGNFPSNLHNFGRFSTGNNNAEGQGQRQKMDTVSGNSIGKCVCDFGFSVTKNGKCLGGYRQTCSRVQRCNHEDNLECLDGSCNCKSPLHQVYDHSSKKCLSLVGAKCDSSRNSANSCIENAHCIQNVCACKDGFSRTPFRHCMLSYGKACDDRECNMHNGLTCKSTSANSTSTNNQNSKSGKKCACVDDSLVYDGQTQSCLSLVGSPCGKIGQAGDYGKDSFYVSCEPGAICREEPGGDKSSRFCRTKEF